MSDTPSSAMPDEFDRILGQLDGLPDVAKSGTSTMRTITPLIGTSQVWIVQTFRQRDRGDTIFLECGNKGGLIRIALPPQVADAIARQRDALTTKIRRRVAKAAAMDRKARGIQPGFMKNRGKRKRTRRGE